MIAVFEICYGCISKTLSARKWQVVFEYENTYVQFGCTGLEKAEKGRWQLD